MDNTIYILKNVEYFRGVSGENKQMLPNFWKMKYFTNCLKNIFLQMNYIICISKGYVMLEASSWGFEHNHYIMLETSCWGFELYHYILILEASFWGFQVNQYMMLKATCWGFRLNHYVMPKASCWGFEHYIMIKLEAST